MTLSRLKPNTKLRIVGDEDLAIACGTVATREPSRNLRSVSAVPASVNYRGHRTYLDPNPRLVHARTTAWRVPGLRGHRQRIL